MASASKILGSLITFQIWSQEEVYVWGNLPLGECFLVKLVQYLWIKDISIDSDMLILNLRKVNSERYFLQPSYG